MQNQVLPLWILLLTIGTGHAQQWQVGDKTFGRFVDQSANWEQVSGDLIKNFKNMYHLNIVKAPTAQDAYPYRGWFFGWATDDCNTRLGLKRGCDMIFAARAMQLEGPWQIYAGDDRWDDGNKPTAWKPVLVAEDRIYNSWHNGDPSVVKHDGLFHMAYSATGFNQDRIPYGKPGDKDSDLNCIMGATSKDGLKWTLTAAPIMIDPKNIGQSPAKAGDFMPPSGAYHRPSLLRTGDKWQLWFDAWDGRDMGMCYAENTGDFSNPEHWKVIRGVDHMALASFPNPDVVKIEDVFIAFADPTGYQPKLPDRTLNKKFLADWAARKICQAVSLNGVDWVPVGFIERDDDAQANQVPVAYTTAVDANGDRRIYLTYATQIFGDYRYDRIRMKSLRCSDSVLNEYRALCRQVFPK